MIRKLVRALLLSALAALAATLVLGRRRPSEDGTAGADPESMEIDADRLSRDERTAMVAELEDQL